MLFLFWLFSKFIGISVCTSWSNLYQLSLQSPMDSSRLVDVKPRISDDIDKIKSWKIPDIVDPSHLKALRLPDPVTAGKVSSVRI